ncbi:protein of unknown function [Chitinophaga ginsengisegetis]|uniref:DUF5017 domain-containing protein n=1 Tax=Chitinophaga ginsengisegetis TaxID=393003 RepID=A0A1T5PAR1_9BACT|nr:DUF5017 domain-containing protein [Chitinophaga ginsengisegetis]MDR6569110.1 hypothetical protein [Chitinophaga ginsengisegetis]MDR6648861.1 hypothetical protein [Chitinophaga ginsengisegetis]MDR6655191.1 hypothetical protein [Chitinophaga ginsengisegetis]SKD09349.1 protein of unknown function [Chitinophaga ginsengisegetis]
MRNSIYLLIIVIIFISCAKEKVTTPSLEVTTSSLTYKAGDTVTFNFTGNPDNITFYSGEPGHNYEFRDRTTAENDLQINFKSLVQFGLVYKNLQLLVSNNYSGAADTTSVRAATWTDISDRAVFSTGQDNTPSGTISLKEFADPKNTAARIYVAFKYTDYKKTQGQNRWVIRTFEANNISADGVVSPLAVLSSGGWKAFDFKNPASVWSVTTAQLLMFGGNKDADDNEDWVITKGFDPFYIKPDAGVALKNISTVLPSYKYVYAKPGTYKVIFDVSAVRYNGEKRTTKELTLTITP